MISHKLSFKIGADPEFALITPSNEVEAADDIVFELIEAQDNDQDGNEVDQFGVDGEGTAAEIRPRPAKSVKQLVKNIGRIFTRASQTFGIFEWSTLSDKIAVGGHIHLELPSNSTFVENESNNTYTKLFYSFYLPMALAENRENANLRRKTSYGSMVEDAVHIDQHGNAWTAEIRAPTAEWLISPKIAAANLAYAAMIHNEILNHRERLEKIPIVATNLDTIRIMEKAIKNNETKYLEELNQLTWKYIQKFELFPKYRAAITYLFKKEEVLKDKAAAGYEILKGWGLTSRPESTSFLSSDKVMKELKKKDKLLNYLKHNNPIIAFDSNNDYGIKSFGKALKNRIIGFNWKPKHYYVLFGTKANIPNLVVADKKMDIILGKQGLTTDALKTQVANGFAKMQQKYPGPDHKPVLYIAIPKSYRETQNYEAFLKLIQYLEFQKTTLPIASLNISDFKPKNPTLEEAEKIVLESTSYDENNLPFKNHTKDSERNLT